MRNLRVEQKLQASRRGVRGLEPRRVPLDADEAWEYITHLQTGVREDPVAERCVRGHDDIAAVPGVDEVPRIPHAADQRLLGLAHSVRVHEACEVAVLDRADLSGRAIGV